MNSVAFITPSFTPDLERCEILVESVRRFAPDVPHYLILDRYDLPNFRHLRGANTILVPAEEVMHKGYHRLPGRKGVWLSLRTPPVRGWIAQQLKKLDAPQFASEETLVCIDSDVAFVRPFDPSHLQEGQKLGLLDVDYALDMVPRWTNVAEKLLGLDHGSVPLRGHVGHLITWSRKTLLELQAKVEATTGLPWQVAIGRCVTFSEYILYGVFVRSLLGYENTDHVPSDRPLVRQPWSHDLASEAGIRSYIADTDPGNIAVMIHSKFGISAKDLRPHFETVWNKAS